MSEVTINAGVEGKITAQSFPSSPLSSPSPRSPQKRTASLLFSSPINRNLTVQPPSTSASTSPLYSNPRTSIMARTKEGFLLLSSPSLGSVSATSFPLLISSLSLLPPPSSPLPAPSHSSANRPKVDRRKGSPKAARHQGRPKGDSWSGRRGQEASPIPSRNGRPPRDQEVPEGELAQSCLCHLRVLIVELH
jgi:hypothetical protein